MKTLTNLYIFFKSWRKDTGINILYMGRIVFHNYNTFCYFIITLYKWVFILYHVKISSAYLHAKKKYMCNCYGPYKLVLIR